MIWKCYESSKPIDLISPPLLLQHKIISVLLTSMITWVKATILLQQREFKLNLSKETGRASRIVFQSPSWFYQFVKPLTFEIWLVNLL